MSILDQIAEVFDSFGIPRHIWEPIGKQESGFDPLAWNQSGEDSRGIYQINLDANPRYAGLDLFDPVVNANIAARDFIGPAYRDISWNPDPGAQAAYVWQYGIRPHWQSVVDSGKDVILMNDARAIAGSIKDTVGETYQPVAEGPDLPKGDSILSSGFWIRAGLFVLFALVLVIMFAGGFWSLAKAFGVESKGGGS
jgi:hypothetical protein